MDPWNSNRGGLPVQGKMAAAPSPLCASCFMRRGARLLERAGRAQVIVAYSLTIQACFNI